MQKHTVKIPIRPAPMRLDNKRNRDIVISGKDMGSSDKIIASSGEQFLTISKVIQPNTPTFSSFGMPSHCVPHGAKHRLITKAINKRKHKYTKTVAMQ